MVPEIDSPPSSKDLEPDETPNAPQKVHQLPPIRRVAPPKVPAPAAVPESGAEAEIRAMSGALGVIFQRLDQQAKLLEGQYQQSQAVTQEMLDTLRILQQAFGQLDDMTDKLARIVAALVKLYQLEQEQAAQTLF
jgi:hypothetical protein